VHILPEPLPEPSRCAARGRRRRVRPWSRQAVNAAVSGGTLW